MFNDLSDTTAPANEINQVEPKKSNRRRDLLVLVLLFAVFAVAFVYFSFKKEDVGDQSRILWKFQGVHLTEPAIANGMVYFVSSPSSGYNSFLYALDADTGREKWKVAIETRSSPPKPVVSTDTIYVVSGKGKLSSVDTATGKLLWSFDGKEPVVWASPVISNDGMVYFGGSDNFYALNAETGKEIWRSKINAVESGEGAIRAVVKDPIVLSDGLVYFSTEDGSLHTLEAKTGKVKLNEELIMGQYPFPPLFANGYIYFINVKRKEVYKFDTKTGRLRSQTKLDLGKGGIYKDSLALHEGILYFNGSFTKDFYAFDVTTGEQKWVFKMKGNSGAYPKVFDGLIYIGNYYEGTFGEMKAYLYTLNAKSGEKIWDLNINSESGVSSTTVSDKAVYVVSGDFLYAIRK